MSKKSTTSSKGTSRGRTTNKAASTAKKKTAKKATRKRSTAKSSRKVAAPKTAKKAAATTKRKQTTKAATKTKAKAAPKKIAATKTAAKKTVAKKAPAKSSKQSTAAKKTTRKRAGGRKKKISEELQARIDHVRGLTGRNRVDELSSVLMETLDRQPLAALAIATVEELGRTASPKAIETLSFAWNNCKNVETRSAMVEALANFPHKQVLAPLERIALSTGVGTELRLQAVEALAQHRTNASWMALGRVLVESAETGDKSLQSASIEAIRSNNGKAVPFLMKALSSKDEEEQVSAATALGVTGDRAALDPLRSLSSKADSLAVKEAATRAAILLYCS